MKKHIYILLITFAIFSLCSCSQNMKSETYFVHCIGFEADGENIKITAVLEKNSENNDKYFFVSKSDSSINGCAKKLMKDYKDCYFATCDLYFLSISENTKALSKIAEEICDSNIFPTTADILCTENDSVENFIKNFNNSEKLTSIKNDTKSKSINTVAFFALFASGKPVTVATVSGKKGSLSLSGSATFSNNRKAVYHDEQQ